MPEVQTRHKLGVTDESLEVVDPDEEVNPSAPLIIPTPPAPNWTTRPQVISIDQPLTAEPVPIPPRTVEHVAAPPPTRSIPLPPPFVMPQPDDMVTITSYDEVVEETPVLPHQISQRSEDDGSPRRIPPRLASNDDNTDNESAPLPVPTRRPPQPRGVSPAASLTSSSRPVRRSLPPPPPPPPVSVPASDVEHDSDLDEILPTPPRYRPTTPGVPPTNEVPLIVPPRHAEEDSPRKVVEPSPLRHSYPPPIHGFSYSRSPTPEDQYPSHPTSTSDHEVLDEEEGGKVLFRSVTYMSDSFFGRSH